MNMSDNIKDKETAEITVALQEIFKNYGIVLEKVEISPGCQPKGNFVSEVLRIKIKGRKKSNGLTTDLEKPFIFKKIPPPSSLSHIFHDCIRMFHNEIAAYESILPAMQNHLNKLSEKVAEKLNFPLYYGHFEKRCILFQDLQEDGYQVVDLVKGLNSEECNAVLETLAKFHAMSFVLKFSDRKKLEIMNEKIEETNFRFENKWRDTLLTMWDLSLLLACKSLRNSKDPRLILQGKLLENFCGNVFQEIVYRMPETFLPTPVFCHGDLWTNNILLKYDESNGHPVSVKFIDLQGMRYASCALDVVQFLFTSANPQKNFTKFFYHYYQTLKENLNRMNQKLDFELIDFIGEIQKKSLFGIFFAFLLFTSMTNEPLKPGDDLDLKHLIKSEELEKVYEDLKPEYHERVRGLMLAILESNLIWQ